MLIGVAKFPDSFVGFFPLGLYSSDNGPYDFPYVFNFIECSGKIFVILKNDIHQIPQCIILSLMICGISNPYWFRIFEPAQMREFFFMQGLFSPDTIHDLKFVLLRFEYPLYKCNKPAGRIMVSIIHQGID